jgi:hypothetical protein
MTKLYETEGKLNWSFYCPGCKCHHGISTIEPHAWSFNGDIDRPTFSPSLRVQSGPKCDPITHLRIPGEPDQVCHSFIKNGMIQFLGDCTHELAGQTVEIPDIDL